MEFVDNTGHIFSLPSYKEKPIGYEYEEYSYVFWIDANNTSKLSVNNFYSEPIYALYELSKDFSIESLEDDKKSPLNIEIYVENSNVFKLISPKELQAYLVSDKYNNLTDYIDLNNLEDNTSMIKTKLTNEDIYGVKTSEDLDGTVIDYLMIPIYPLANASEEGVWITNVMIHIEDKSIGKHEWCYISVGGEFLNEYEELIINGKNQGVNLPKDILKAVYAESLYNNEFNETLYNEKLKEYLMNIMTIKGECGNFKSAIHSLQWFGYGDKLTISKLLKTDNDYKNQYIRDYFDITNDTIYAFKTFVTDSLISLMIMINKETNEQYQFEPDKYFFGENKPKLLSLLYSYIKIKIGNHDMPIEEDDEKYWYWKSYFNFSLVELGIKLALLKYFYKKYFLPIHLNVHKASLGYLVFANDIKLTSKIGYNITYPLIAINDREKEVEFLGKGLHYFTKQIHYVDEEYNEYYVSDVETDERIWYSIHDTCVNIPIKFLKSGYYNCVLLLHFKNETRVLFESHFSFEQNDEYEYKNFIIYPKKLNVTISKVDNTISVNTNYFEYWVNNREFTIDLLVNNKWYSYDFKLRIHNPIIDFGRLKYRYYLNDHNYLTSKIKSLNSIKGNHYILYTAGDDINTLINKEINDPNDLYEWLEDNNYNVNNTFIDMINFDDDSTLYQYFKQNYNLYSPFKQLKYIDENNHKILFNSYMHNKSLVNMNNIDFDINFYKILQYHLDNNLMYIDGTLLNNEFYQYIIYEYKFNGKTERAEIVIHKDLIGNNIIIPEQYLHYHDNIMICAWNDYIYILSESGYNDDTYTLTKVSELYLMEEDSYDQYLAFDSLEFTYKLETKSYWKGDNEYLIYDKLYSNSEKIYEQYQSLVNLPNNLKYKNNIHLFGLYTSIIEERNKLFFHNDIHMYVNGIRFDHDKYLISKDNNKEYESLKFYINGNLDELVDTRYPDVYSLEWVKNPRLYNYSKLTNVPDEIKNILDQYGIFVKRNYKKFFEESDIENRPNIWELENIDAYDTNEFCYYIEERQFKLCTVYYKTLDDLYINNQLGNIEWHEYEDKDIKLYIKDNKYYFDDPNVIDLNDVSKGYSNKLTYEVEFVDDENRIMYDVSLRDIENLAYNKIKVIFYCNKPHIVRNRFYMLNEFINNNLDLNPIVYEENGKYYLDTVGNSKVELIKFSEKYRYFDVEENHEILNQNPSMYWYNIDNDKLVTLPSYLNELERYAYNVNNMTISELTSYLDTYIHKNTESQLNNTYIDDHQEALFYYKNYLEKDLTGWVGEYRIELETNLEDENEIRLLVEIINNENVKTHANNENHIFELNGTESKVTLFIQFSNNVNKEYFTENNIYFIPKLIQIIKTDKRIEYDYEQCGGGELPYIHTKFINKEYVYGNNDTEFVYNLYNDFFKLKFNIYDSYINNESKLSLNLLESVYDINDSIKLDTYLNYDFYLMHDDKYWYGLYISQETCDKARNNSDLLISNENKLMSFNSSTLDMDYVLKYERTSQEYLINRLEFNSSNGYNHFKDDDIIACYIHNNDVLPFNASISSKWDIKPMSIGMHTDTSYESNGEMTVLSLPIQSSKYQHGYYNVNIRYSLDRDIQHQFKNTTKILVS